MAESRNHKGAGACTVAVVLGDVARAPAAARTSDYDFPDARAIRNLHAALDSLDDYRFICFTNHDTLIADLTAVRDDVDLVLNLCDEGFGNDAAQELHVAALFDLLGLPYTGSPPHALAHCYDKFLVEAAVDRMGIPTPRSLWLTNASEVPDLEFPLFVKPNFGDGSFAIGQHSVVRSASEFERSVSIIRQRLGYDGPLLAQEFLPGADVSVGLLGNGATGRVLPIIEEDYGCLPPGLPHVNGREAKWEPDSPYWQIDWVPARLPARTHSQIADWSVAVFDRLGCRDYGRVDWRLDRHGQPRLLEVNPNPGWDDWTHLSKMAALAGMSYRDLLADILSAARIRSGPPYVRSK